MAFQLAGTPRVSDRLRPPILIERVDFLVWPSPFQKGARWVVHIVTGILITGMVWGASFATWLLRLPKIMANIEVREGDSVVFTK